MVKNVSLDTFKPAYEIAKLRHAFPNRFFGKRGMKTEISCLNTRALIQYVKARNPEQLHLLWAPLKNEVIGREHPERFLSNPGNWISVEQCVAVMEQTKKVTSDEMAVFKAAFAYGNLDGGIGLGKRVFRSSRDTRRMLTRIQASRVLASRHMEIVSVGDANAVIRLYWPAEQPLTRDFCLFAKGLYQGLPVQFNLAPARLWETVCYFDGGPCCQYEIWWDAKPTEWTWRRKASSSEKVAPEPASPDITADTKEEVKARGDGGQAVTPFEAGLAFTPKTGESMPPITEKVAERSAAEKGDGLTGVREETIAKEQEDMNARVEGLGRQLGHLFGGIRKIVSLMLLDSDHRHPYVEHLKGVAQMVEKGEELREQLVSLTRRDWRDVAPRPDDGAVPREKQLPEGVVGGAETVLLVDDEDMLVDVGRQILQAMGYHVLVAGNGSQAVEVYQKNKDQIDLVIMDVVMPGMGGGEALGKMKEIDPQVKVLLATGYTPDGGACNGLPQGHCGLIQKPFSMKDLSKKIREVLDGEDL
jgi:CheY-like chemotaxis protein